MDASLLLEYGWVLLVLVALEGILAADNALVMAHYGQTFTGRKTQEGIILRTSRCLYF